MTAAYPIQNQFNGGEFSRRVQWRVDQPVFQTGLEAMENFLPTVEGPALKRSGFLHVVLASSTASWISEFRFNLTQSYVEEWAEGKVRFYTNNARIETVPGTAYEVAVPYTAAQAPSVWAQQSFDRQYLAHPSHKPRRLTRTSALTFALDDHPFANGPFADLNKDEAITVTASGVSGPVTLTATSAIFGAGRVGSFFRVEAKDFSTLPAWDPGIDGNVSGTTKRKSDGKAYLAQSSGRTGTLAPSHDQGSEWDGASAGLDINAKGPYGVLWEYLSDIFGIVRIDAVAPDGLSCSATVIRRLPDSLTSVPTSYWQHGAFSVAEGWPSIVFIWQQRLCWIKDFWLYGSVAGDYNNHQDFTSNGLLAPDLAFRRRMAISDPPLWVMPDRDSVLLGTATGEYLISPLNPADGISGANIKLTDQENYGSAHVHPLKLGRETVYVERAGQRVRASEYAFERDRYPSDNLTELARHITGLGITQLCWMQTPEQLLGAVRSDGQLAVHAHDAKQQVRGWCRTKLAAGGVILSAVGVPAPDAAQDDCWALVQRDGVKSIERQMPHWDEDRSTLQNAFFVDSGLIYDGLATTALPAAPHLAGRTIRLLADGAKIPDLTVASDGSIPPLPFAASKVSYGLGYAARLKSLRFEQRDRYGQSALSRKKRIVRMVLGLIDTAQAIVKVGKFSETFLRRAGRDVMGEAPPLFNGISESKAVGGDWDRDGEWELISDDQLPCMVGAAMPQVEISA